MRRRAVLGAIPSVLGVMLAVLGNVLGNVVTAGVPTAWKGMALPLLGVVVLALLGVSVFRHYVIGNASSRDQRLLSRSRRQIGRALLVVYEVLWVLGGLLSNVAASTVPKELEQYAGQLLAGVAAIGIHVAV